MANFVPLDLFQKYFTHFFSSRHALGVSPKTGKRLPHFGSEKAVQYNFGTSLMRGGLLLDDTIIKEVKNW